MAGKGIKLKSTQDIAYDCLKKKRKPVEFTRLWKEVSTNLGIDENQAKNKLIKFYNSMSLDARFVQLSNNRWDLRSRHTFEAIQSEKSKYQEDVLDLDELDEDEYEDYLADGEEESSDEGLY